jgi:hypothetical protein
MDSLRRVSKWKLPGHFIDNVGLTRHVRDDPWNQTAADNAEWLQRFKRDVGITNDGGPGLPPGYAWSVKQGGSGFAPPYAVPKSEINAFDTNVQVEMRDGAKPVTAGQVAANSFLETLTSPDSRPAKVFCSRELESGLLQYVEMQVLQAGHMPSDEEIRSKGKEILQAQTTAADDDMLLAKFKELVQVKLSFLAQEASGRAEAASVMPSAMPTNVDVNISDADIGAMLQDMDFELEPQLLGTSPEDDVHGGVSLFDSNQEA